MQEIDGFGDRKMRIEYFSAKYLNELHRKAQMVWEEEETQAGWQKSRASPMDVLRIFPGIWVKKGYVLRAYVFRSGSGGNGIVWAMPENSVFPEVEECERLDDVLSSPKPYNAVPFTEVIEGDGSLQSYIMASIFVREMFEFGASWHGRQWSEHEIVGRRRRKWDVEWLEDVDSLRPRVVSGRNVVVEFFTYSRLGVEAVYRHRDIYLHKYRFRSEVEVVAAGGVGYVP